MPARKPLNRVIRDIYCLTPAEHARLLALKRRATALAGDNVSKSDILRLGIEALEALGDSALRERANRLARPQVGRPPAASRR